MSLASRRGHCIVWTALALLIGAGEAFAQYLPTGFAIQPVIAGIFGSGRPVGFAELPDGRFLIVERNTGQVRLYPVGGATAPVVYTQTGITIEVERGLLGVAVDPEWPARPYVYLFYTYFGQVSRLTMYTCTGDLVNPLSTNLVLSSPYQLLTDIPDLSEIHNGGTIRFGADGMLYLSLGNDGNSCNSQDLSLLSGAILRLDVSAMPGEGSGPPPKADITPIDNPFPGPGDNERLHYVWGLRNPFRFTIDAITNDLYIGDVGGSNFEEIDRVPFSGGGGENFGWPHFEGTFDPQLGLTCGINNTFTAPIYEYAHSFGAAVIGGPLYHVQAGAPRAFPAEYEGSLFLTDFLQNWIRRLIFNGSSWVIAPPVPGQPSALNWAQSVNQMTDFQLGSDGALYLMRLAPGGGGVQSGLFRVIPTPASGVDENVAVSPQIRAMPNPAQGRTGVSIEWSGLAGARNLGIFDSAGRLVQSWRLKDSDQTSGSVFWDGRARDQRPLPAGVYFYSLDEGSTPRTGKIVLLR